MDIKVKDKVNQRHVGRNLQRIRVYLGMKQEALAADLGISQQEISKIEKLKIMCSFSILQGIDSQKSRSKV